MIVRHRRRPSSEIRLRPQQGSSSPRRRAPLRWLCSSASAHFAHWTGRLLLAALLAIAREPGGGLRPARPRERSGAHGGSGVEVQPFSGGMQARLAPADLTEGSQSDCRSCPHESVSPEGATAAVCLAEVGRSLARRLQRPRRARADASDDRRRHRRDRRPHDPSRRPVARRLRLVQLPRFRSRSGDHRARSPSTCRNGARIRAGRACSAAPSSTSRSRSG